MCGSFKRKNGAGACEKAADRKETHAIQRSGKKGEEEEETLYYMIHRVKSGKKEGRANKRINLAVGT